MSHWKVAFESKLLKFCFQNWTQTCGKNCWKGY